MMSRKLPFLFLLVAAFTTPIRAQAPPSGSVSGLVADEATQTPLNSATVAVFDEGGAFVTGTATSTDGRFTLELPVGTYMVRASFVGYASWEREDVRVARGENVDLGSIVLSELAIEAGEAEVVGERELVEQRADRTVYNVAAQPVTAGGSAIETLQTLPSIEVDTEGNISLRGSQNVAIHVNGRPVPVRGSMLTTLLRQIPASNVERVEVLPNPSARYEPDGMSGIINIVLKQGTERGLSGGITVGGGTSPDAEVSGNVSYQKGAIDVYASYGFRLQSFAMNGSSTRVSFLDSGESTLAQGLDFETGQGSHLFSGTLDYKLGPMTTAGLNTTLGINAGNSDFITSYQFDPGATNAEMERFADVDTDGLTSDVSVNATHLFAGDAHQLKGEARFSRNAEDRLDDFLNRPLIPLGAEDLSRSTADELVDEASAQLDYNVPLVGLGVEAGGKFTYRSMQNDRLYEVFTADGPIVMDGRSNEFDYGEGVLAGYLQASRSFGSLDAQAGLRAESATRDLDLSRTNEQLSDDYFALYPSAFLQYTFNPGTLAKVGFSRRVNRPRPFQLDPTPQFEDTLMVDAGNPNLRPEFTNAFELTLQYKYFVTLTPFFRRTTDVIRRRILFDPATGGTTGTFQNLDTQDTYGADLTFMPRIGPVRGVLSASAYRSVTDGGSIETGLASDGFVWSVRGNVQAQLRKGTDLQLFAFYRAPMEVEDGRISPFGIASLGISQQLMGDRLRLTVRVNDLLRTSKFEFRTGNTQYRMVGIRDPDLQQLSATLNYTFGKPARPRPPRPQQDQQDPMGGGLGF